MIADPSPLPWLQILLAPNSEFERRVEAAYGPEAMPVLQPVLPYAIAVTNGSSSIDLAGVTVRYVAEKGGKHWSTITFGPPLRGGNTLVANTRPEPQLAAGATRVWTPFRQVNGALVFALVQRSRPQGRIIAGGGAGGGFITTAGNERREQFEQADSVRASVDLAISTDGRYAGKDDAGIVEQIHNIREALTELRNELLARMDQGESDAALIAWLTPIASREQQHITPENGLVYMRRRLAAQNWLNYVQKGQRNLLFTISLDDIPPRLQGTLQ